MLNPAFRPGRARRLSALSLGVIVALSLGACTSTGSDSSGGDDEPITLTVADKDNPAQAVGVAMEEAIAAFKVLHPNVTIERDNQAPGDYNTTFALRATGPNPPDVFEILFGRAGMGTIVEANAILPLDDYAAQYGWADRIPSSLLDSWSFTEGGVTWGEGSLYGVSNSVEMTGVYYNKEKLSELGVEFPSDIKGFEDVLAAAKAAGEVPIQFGNGDAWPAVHTFLPIQNSFTAPADLEKWIHGVPNAPSFASAGNVEAATTLQDWANAGYFAEGYAGTSYDDAMTKFIDGEGVFFINGSWAYATLGQKMGDNVGFAFMPGLKSSSPPAANGQSGPPYGISSKSQHPDLAAEFIDLLVSEKLANTILSNGGIPTVSSILEGAEDTSPVVQAWQDLSANGALVSNATAQNPGMNKTIESLLQELFGGKISPQEFVDSVQQAWLPSGS